VSVSGGGLLLCCDIIYPVLVRALATAEPLVERSWRITYVTLHCCLSRRAIDQEKAVYKQSCDRLRVLKPEIEHIRKVCL
jgi:hypothetical protein